MSIPTHSVLEQQALSDKLIVEILEPSIGAPALRRQT
jgi:hypothetical protein